jgi:hypothetical protein
MVVERVLRAQHGRKRKNNIKRAKSCRMTKAEIWFKTNSISSISNVLRQRSN